VAFGLRACGGDFQTKTDRKEHPMTARSKKRSVPWFERMEDRRTPGTLMITPPAFIDPVAGLAVPDLAKPGLQMAQDHTKGVVAWSPEG
jgi:hypothetical protein